MLDDLLRHFTEAYFRMPNWTRSLIGGLYRRIPVAWRMGRTYRETQDVIRESEYWPLARHRVWQWTRIQETLRLAYDHVPFYRRRFDALGIRPEDLRSFDEFQRLPFLTKAEVKEHLGEMTSTAIPRWKWLATTTGGSTREPLRFYQLKGVTRSKERAFIHDMWGRFGYRPGLRAVQIKGRRVGRPDRGCFWEYEPIQNILEMDSHYLVESNLAAYVKAIRAFQPEFLIGYVSSVYLLARFLEEHPDEPFPKIRGLFLASENLYPWQRALFTRVFQCPICSHYGHSEMVLLGAECPFSPRYHFYPQYGYLELIGPHGQPCTRPGEIGELVGTAFDNPVMPFIRYRTEDYGVLGVPSCACGRNYPILDRIEGRLQEFIVTRSGRLISICVMGAAHFDMLDNVYQTQYYQEEPGKVEFRVVPRRGFTADDLRRIQAALQARMDDDVAVTVRVVKEIPRTPSGKHRMIIQKIERPEFLRLSGEETPA